MPSGWKAHQAAEAWEKRSDPDRKYPPVCYKQNGEPRTGKYMEVCHRPCRPAHFKNEASKRSPWMLALKKFNAQNTTWCVPKKNSRGYTECMKYKKEFQRAAGPTQKQRKKADDDTEEGIDGMTMAQYDRYVRSLTPRAPYVPSYQAPTERELVSVNYGGGPRVDLPSRRREVTEFVRAAESSAQGRARPDIPRTNAEAAARAVVAANKVAEERKKKEDAARLAEDYRLAHQMAVKDAAAVAARRERHRELTGYYPLASTRSGRARGFH
jgi:hypothetical protein